MNVEAYHNWIKKKTRIFSRKVDEPSLCKCLMQLKRIIIISLFPFTCSYNCKTISNNIKTSATVEAY